MVALYPIPVNSKHVPLAILSPYCHDEARPGICLPICGYPLGSMVVERAGGGDNAVVFTPKLVGPIATLTGGRGCRRSIALLIITLARSRAVTIANMSRHVPIERRGLGGRSIIQDINTSSSMPAFYNFLNPARRIQCFNPTTGIPLHWQYSDSVTRHTLAVSICVSGDFPLGCVCTL